MEVQTQPQGQKRKVRVVAISDTHSNYTQLKKDAFPPADIFIHAGDLTNSSAPEDFQAFRQFIKGLPYKHKIVIGGNHDFGLESSKSYKQKFEYFGLTQKDRVDSQSEVKKLKQVCTYLVHDYIEVEGVRIFASPYMESKYVQGFQVDPKQGEHLWSTIPKNLHILVTHMPPFGVLDKIKKGSYSVGSKPLREAVRKKEPKIHIFGHIHECHGYAQIGNTQFYNVAALDDMYYPKHKPTLIEFQIQK